jgi:hypothetical protein
MDYPARHADVAVKDKYPGWDTGSLSMVQSIG